MQIKYRNMTPEAALDHARSVRPRVLLAPAQWQACNLTSLAIFYYVYANYYYSGTWSSIFWSNCWNTVPLCCRLLKCSARSTRDAFPYRARTQPAQHYLMRNPVNYQAADAFWLRAQIKTRCHLTKNLVKHPLETLKLLATPPLSLTASILFCLAVKVCCPDQQAPLGAAIQSS